MASILNTLGSETISMMSTGRTDKAVLYVYLVDLFDDKDDDKDISQEIEDISRLEKGLMKKASQKLSALGKLKGAAAGRASDALNSVIPGNNSSQYIGDIDKDYTNFVKFYVQYNPATISMSTMTGRQEKKANDGGIDNVRVFDFAGKTKLSFDLIFDDCDNMDAFGMNEIANLNVTSGVNKLANIYANGATGFSVRKRMDAIMSLLSTISTQQVVFFWGKTCFRGLLTDVNNKFTMFNGKGNPIRGEMHIEITQDAGQSERFGYDEKYWDEAFQRCFKNSSEGFLASSAGSTVSDKLKNNSIINLGI
ncbi:CIS tube protein [Butyrivibrio sp. AE3004]|uniref:CIS tube protein n=1 Tax=Butyrivibrio sp. AE3004 TaxID=1506994 RepID=UPI000494A4D9|nr:hypothetical protein [Butyrivibrio sp. AE3004]